MKKMIIVLIIFACIAHAQKPISARTAQEVRAKSAEIFALNAPKDLPALKARLIEAVDPVEKKDISDAIVNLTAVGQKKTEAVKLGMPSNSVKRAEIYDLPMKSKTRNDLVMEYLSEGGKGLGTIRRFAPHLATEAECVAYYEAVLENIKIDPNGLQPHQTNVRLLVEECAGALLKCNSVNKKDLTASTTDLYPELFGLHKIAAPGSYYGMKVQALIDDYLARGKTPELSAKVEALTVQINEVAAKRKK